MNAILIAMLMSAAAPSFRAETLDGKTVAGPLVELSADRLSIDAAEGRVSLDSKNLLTVTPTSIEKTKPAARRAGVVVELMDGGVVRGRQYVSAGDRAKITLDGGAIVEAPTRMVRTVRCEPREDDPLAVEWARLLAMKVDADLLAIRGDGTIDYHKGVIHDVTEDAVRFDLDGEMLPIKRSKVFGFIYRHGEPADLPRTVCRITDTAGSIWPAAALKLADALRWTTPAGFSVSQPLENIAAIDFSSGKQVYLSDLKPDSAGWTPYFGVEAPSPAMKRYFSPRFDRGFDPGDSLRLGGKLYRKGVALRGGAELVYRLPERFGRFHAMAGIADGVPAGGRVRLVIRGDDRVLFEGDVATGDAPRPLDLDLVGVRRLTIRVDFGEGLVAGDHLLLCNPRLTK